MRTRYLAIGAVCLLGVWALSGTATGEPTKPPSQVEVVNFPAVQEVAGTVDACNLVTTTADGALLFDSRPLYSTNPVFDCIPASDCCKICSKGKACGDSCIRREYTCHKGRGCACNSYEGCKD